MTSNRKLFQMVKNGDLAKLQKLPDLKDHVNAIRHGKSLFSQAALMCKKPNLNAIAIAGLLIDNGANTEVRGRSGLHFAAQSGNEGLAMLLLEKGADLEKKNSIGQTALHVAVGKRNIKMVNLLLEKGADIEAKDNMDRTALHYAASYCSWHEDLLLLLIKKGADLEARDNQGRLAIYYTKSDRAENILAYAAEKKQEQFSETWSEEIPGVVTHSCVYPKAKHVLTEVFNFNSGNYMVLSANLETKAEGVSQPQNLDSIDQKLVETARTHLRQKTEGSAVKAKAAAGATV